MLYGAGWIACSVKMSMSSDNATCNFRRDNDKASPAWHPHKVVSWNDHNNVGDACKIAYKISDVTWGKCTHVRKQDVEDSQ